MFTKEQEQEISKEIKETIHKNFTDFYLVALNPSEKSTDVYTMMDAIPLHVARAILRDLKKSPEFAVALAVALKEQEIGL